MKLAEAQEAASELVALLRDSCEKAVIGGSIRRRKPEPKDIEIVCIPRFQHRLQITQETLWGQPDLDRETTNLLDERCHKLLDQGILATRLDKNGRACWGFGVKRAEFLHRGAWYKTDIFACIPPTGQWGHTLAIRTGPGDFNKLLVTSQKFGGTCPLNRKVAGGRVWDTTEFIQEYPMYDFAAMPATKFVKVAEPAECPVIPTPDEATFFAALGVPCWEPEQRTRMKLHQFLGR